MKFKITALSFICLVNTFAFAAEVAESVRSAPATVVDDTPMYTMNSILPVMHRLESNAPEKKGGQCQVTILKRNDSYYFVVSSKDAKGADDGFEQIFIPSTAYPLKADWSYDYGDTKLKYDGSVLTVTHNNSTRSIKFEIAVDPSMRRVSRIDKWAKQAVKPKFRTDAEGPAAPRIDTSEIGCDPALG